MKSNCLKFILGCFIASLFFACGSEDVQVVEKVPVVASKTDNTPNDDSELALLMRKMFLDADSIKLLIIDEEGEIPSDFILDL